MKKIAILICAIPVFAHAGNFVPIELSERTIHFTSDRVSQNKEGQILVCPLDAITIGNERVCKKSGADGWMPMMNLKITGYQITGFTMDFAGSYSAKQLIVHFKKEASQK